MKTSPPPRSNFSKPRLLLLPFVVGHAAAFSSHGCQRKGIQIQNGLSNPTHGDGKRAFCRTGVTLSSTHETDSYAMPPNTKRMSLQVSFTPPAALSPESSIFDDMKVKPSTLSWPTFPGDGDSTLSSRTQKKELSGVDTKSALAMLSSALLITSNTVGAGTMILPDVASEAGIASTIPLVIGLYCINLVSGLAISDVAIKQFEAIRKTSGGFDDADVPSSFKDLADATLGERAGGFVSTISVLSNYCILAFALMRSGEVLNISGMLGTNEVSAGFALIVAGLVATFSDKTLSKVTSTAVSVLFGTYAALLVPGLLNMQDPMVTLMTPGTNVESGLIGAVAQAAPIFLTTMLYQNIVPVVTKMLNYDRCQTKATIVLGSAMPPLMYLAWCFVVLGGGVDSSTVGGPLLTAFSMASLVGASVAGVMSIAEEFESIVPKLLGQDHQQTSAVNKSKIEGKDQTRSLPSVLLAVIPPLLAGVLFSDGEGFTSSLSIAGAYGSPLLYGVIPAMMCLAQTKNSPKTSDTGGFVPGGAMGLASLGILSVGFIGQELVSDFGGMFLTSA